MMHSCKSLFVYAFIVFTCFTLTKGIFFVVAPNEFRPGWPYYVAVTVHKNVSGQVFVNVRLGPADDPIDLYSFTNGAVSPGETKLLTMDVPASISNTQGLLTITATGGLLFSQEKTIACNRNASLVLVETDKNIYKPGQKVQIRLVHVDRHLHPNTDPLTVVIVNPKDLKLEEYKDLKNKTGVSEVTYELLPSSSVGSWKILVRDGHNFLLSTKTFTVEEYVLPRFSVEIVANPSYLLSSHNELQPVVTVTAKYTHGRPVQGSCSLRLERIFKQRYPGIQVFPEVSRNGDVILEIHKPLTDAGSVDFTSIEWAKFNDIWRSGEIQVTANVTDETGRQESARSQISSYPSSTKVEFLPKSTTVFRPGLPAHVFIRVSDHAGNPVGVANVRLDISLTGIEPANFSLQLAHDETVASFSFIPVLANNSHKWDPYSNSITAQVNVAASSQKNASASTEVHLYNSVTKSFVTASLNSSQESKVGDMISYQVFFVNAGDSTYTLSYAVIGQGRILTAGSPNDENFISFVVSQEMCPSAKVVVYMLVQDAKQEAEVLADVFDVSPTGCFNKEVKVSFSAKEMKTGTKTSLDIQVNRLDGSNSLPGIHHVYYLGLDKSLVLLQGQPDLNTDAVLSSLSDLGKLSSSASARMLTSAGKIFQMVELAVFTTASLQGKSYKYLEAMDTELQGILFSARSGGKIVPSVVMSDSPPAASHTIRKHFPETWLWGSAATNPEGRLQHQVTLPDTITTWMVSAFAINSEGLAVGAVPFELTAFQEFFLTMNLPYSIKKGEVFILRITVFNYRKQDVSASVTLNASSNFKVVADPNQEENYEEIVEVPSNKAASVEFKIEATQLGLIELQVVGQDLKDGTVDELFRKLLVQPEGVMRSHAITKTVTVDSGFSKNETFNIPWPENIVTGSQRVEVKVTGDLLGQSLSNMDSLVSVPYGCGEQNMITTVPNIFGLSYLQATDQSTGSEIEQKMLANIKTGYQRQVDRYRHSDGSFSAWGETSVITDHGSSPNSGSVWLTAFVLKSFSKAAAFISVDPKVLSSGATFLISKQTNGGSFIESGQVFHKEMQSQTGAGSGLSVYVLVSLLETNKALKGKLDVNLKQVVQRCLAYCSSILSSLLSTADTSYLAAVGAYALSLTSSSSSQSLVQKLLDLVTASGAPWEVSTNQNTEKQNDWMPYTTSRSGSYNIEIASYYLLALTNLNRLDEGISIMKWLQSQQNSLGGYYSTQDTVMALQALSEFGAAFKKSGSATSVNIWEPNNQISLALNLEGTRSLLLQTVELPPDSRTVVVRVEGPTNSSCIVKVVYTFYTLAGEDKGLKFTPELSLTTRTTRLSDSLQKVETCISSSKDLKYNGMFVTTVNLPSGEVAFDDVPTILANNPSVSRVETSEGLINFYLNNAPGSSGYCLHARVEKQTHFEVQKPGSARLFAYYEPETSQEVALASTSDFFFTDDSTRLTVPLLSVLIASIICMLA